MSALAFVLAVLEDALAALALSIVVSAGLALATTLLLCVLPGMRARHRYTAIAIAFAAAASLAPAIVTAGLLHARFESRSASASAPLPSFGRRGPGSSPAITGATRRAPFAPLLTAPRFASAGVSQVVPRVVPPAIGLALAAVWAAGALGGLVRLARRVIALRALKVRARPLAHTSAGSALAVGARRIRGATLAASDRVDVPVAIGFRHPAILVPERVAAGASAADLAHVILHEEAHLARYDDIANLIQLAAEALYWCNPAVAFLGARLRFERELAADERVVDATGAARAYAASLVRLLDLMRAAPCDLVAPAALRSKRELAVRVERLVEHDRRAREAPAAGVRSNAVIAAMALASLTVAMRLAPAIAAGVPMSAQHAGPIAAAPHARPTPAPDRAALARHLTRARALARALVAATTAPLRPGTQDRSVAALAPEIDREIGRAIGALSAIAPVPGGGTRRLTSGQDARGLDLREIHLSGLDLHGIDLRGANLGGAVLAGDDLAGARLDAADLHGATLDGVDLDDASLRGVRMAGARVAGGSLRRATFARSDLRNTVFDGSRPDANSLAGARLDGARIGGWTGAVAGSKKLVVPG